jgi:hypothetical protein
MLRVTTAPALNPQRQKLASAIARRDELRIRLGAMEAAKDSMMRDSWELQKRYEDAAAAVDQADGRHITNIVEIQMGRPPVEGLSPDQARAAVERLQDELETMQRARDHLAAQRDKVERELERGNSEVRECVRNAAQMDLRVLALCGRFAACQKELVSLTRCMEALAKVGGVPAAHKNWQNLVMPDYDFVELDSWKSWERACADLANDAATEFPATS